MTPALDESIAARTITFLAPSKTYNLPGFGCFRSVLTEALGRMERALFRL